MYVGHQWLLVGEAKDHDAALRIMRESVVKNEGFTRVIVQHVIERFDAGQLHQKRRSRGARRQRV